MLMGIPRDEAHMLIRFEEIDIDVPTLVRGARRPMSSLYRQISEYEAAIVLNESGKFLTMFRESVKTLIRFTDAQNIQHTLHEIGRIYQQPHLNSGMPREWVPNKRPYSLSGTRKKIIGANGVLQMEDILTAAQREMWEELKIDIGKIDAVLKPANQAPVSDEHPSSIYPGLRVSEHMTFVDCWLAECPVELRSPPVADDDHTFIMFEWSPPFHLLDGVVLSAQIS